MAVRKTVLRASNSEKAHRLASALKVTKRFTVNKHLIEKDLISRHEQKLTYLLAKCDLTFNEAIYILMKLTEV